MKSQKATQTNKACLLCGEPIRKQRTFCSYDCAHEHMRMNAERLIPPFSPEELKELYTGKHPKSLTTIGKMAAEMMERPVPVNHHTVKKWLQDIGIAERTQHEITIEGMPAKDCSLCGERKHLSEFHKQSASSDGYRHECRECHSKVAAEARKKRLRDDPSYAGQCRERGRAWRQKRREKLTTGCENEVIEKACRLCGNTKPITAFRAGFHLAGRKAECRDCEKSRRNELMKDSDYHNSYNARVLAWQKYKYHTDSDYKARWNKNRLARLEKLRQEHPEKLKELYRKRYIKYLDYARAYQQLPEVRKREREWRRSHYRTDPAYRHRLKQQRYKRRLLISASRERHTFAEWDELCRRYGYCCLRCGEKKLLTVDHIRPLSKGGSDGISNIQPLCFSCNSSKGTKEIDYRCDRAG